MSDDQAARYLVAPDKYLLYTCDDIAREAQTKAARELELQQLMAKAGTDATGRLVGDMAYRSEYLSVRGELNELRHTAADKHCAGDAGRCRARHARQATRPCTDPVQGARRITASEPSARPSTTAGGPDASAMSARSVTALAGSGTLAISRGCGAKLTDAQAAAVERGRGDVGYAVAVEIGHRRSCAIARVPAM